MNLMSDSVWDKVKVLDYSGSIHTSPVLHQSDHTSMHQHVNKWKRIDNVSTSLINGWAKVCNFVEWLDRLTRKPQVHKECQFWSIFFLWRCRSFFTRRNALSCKSLALCSSHWNVDYLEYAASIYQCCMVKTHTSPQGSQFFHFDIQNFRNVTASGVHTPSYEVHAPSTGNPGSTLVPMGIDSLWNHSESIPNSSESIPMGTF